jgi:hypothetical protein
MSVNRRRNLAWFAASVFVALFGTGEAIWWVRAAWAVDGVVRGSGRSLARWSPP